MPLVFVGNQIGAAGSTVTVDPTSGAIIASPVAGQNLSLTSGNFLLGSPASKIVPGATSLSFQNHANSQSNVIILDSGKVGIGTMAPTDLLHIVNTSTTSRALSIYAAAEVLRLQQTTDWAATTGATHDSVDILHYSNGDGIYVAHVGGLKPGYTGPRGANAALNVLIPYFRDDIGNGRAGTIINDHTGMVGLSVMGQPTTAYTGITLAYYGSTQALQIVNQDPTDGYPQGNGVLATLRHYGTANMVRVEHHQGSATTLLATRFDVSASAPFLQLGLNTDSTGEFILSWNGALNWGPGTSGIDTSIARSGVGQVKLSNELRIQQAAGAQASRALALILSGEMQYRWQTDASGKMQWGPGNAGFDTNLFRSAAGTLRTDSRLSLGGLLLTAMPTTASAGFNLPHGVHPNAPSNGDVWSTPEGIFARINGVTKSVVTA